MCSSGMKALLRRHRAFEFLRDISRREAGADDLVRGGCRNSRHGTVLLQSPHGLSLRFATLPRRGLWPPKKRRPLSFFLSLFLLPRKSCVPICSVYLITIRGNTLGQVLISAFGGTGRG